MSEFNFNFHNRSLDYLPVDGITRVYSRQVFNCIFSYVRPHSVLNPDVVAYSIDALHSLGMYRGKTTLSAEEEYELSMYMSGNLIPENATPYATNYCGYQFGTFAGQLGDGAAISLGEVISTEHLDVDDARLHNRGGDNSPVPCVLNRLELNIKGAGLTPFSRK